jgi:hypothetical protein
VQAVKAITQVRKGQQALQAAQNRAAELRNLPRDGRPTATSAVVGKKDIYIAESTGKLPTEIHSVLQESMPTVSKTAWDVASCAEFNAVNQALLAGEKVGDLVVATVRVQTGLPFPMCPNCVITLKGFTVITG